MIPAKLNARETSGGVTSAIFISMHVILAVLFFSNDDAFTIHTTWRSCSSPFLCAIGMLLPGIECLHPRESSSG
jgi:hypothetical protein